jgi:hypothetical protein
MVTSQIDYISQVKTGLVSTKYMTFKITVRKPKTTVWGIYNNSSKFQLGTISYYPSWRQYVFDPQPNTTFNNGCLIDIINVLNALNKLQKDL